MSGNREPADRSGDESTGWLGGRRVLLTGATGFIGGHLWESLAAAGSEILAVGRRGLEEGLPAGSRFRSLELTNFDDVLAALLDFRPEVIYHLAGKVNAGREADLILPTMHANLVGTVNLLRAALEAESGRFVWVGSSELSSRAPVASPYAASKAAARVYLQLFSAQYGLPVVAAHPFSVYGPGQAEGKLIPYTILCMLRGEPPRLSSGLQVRDFVYVEDVVNGLLRAGVEDKAIGSEIDLGSGEGRSVRDVIGLIQRLSGTTVEPQFGARPERAGEMRQVADVAAARTILGWEPGRSLEEGLRETIEWYRARQ